VGVRRSRLLGSVVELAQSWIGFLVHPRRRGSHRGPGHLRASGLLFQSPGSKHHAAHSIWQRWLRHGVRVSDVNYGNPGVIDAHRYLVAQLPTKVKQIDPRIASRSKRGLKGRPGGCGHKLGSKSPRLSKGLGQPLVRAAPLPKGLGITIGREDTAILAGGFIRGGTPEKKEMRRPRTTQRRRQASRRYANRISLLPRQAERETTSGTARQ
jgi:hypothetical protein